MYFVDGKLELRAEKGPRAAATGSLYSFLLWYGVLTGQTDDRHDGPNQGTCGTPRLLLPVPQQPHEALGQTQVLAVVTWVGARWIFNFVLKFGEN